MVKQMKSRTTPYEALQTDKAPKSDGFAAAWLRRYECPKLRHSRLSLVARERQVPGVFQILNGVSQVIYLDDQF
jgi:hypothetical protein